MLYENNEKYGRLVVDNTFVASLWQGAKNGAIKLWEAISSCFGSGWWRSEDSWSNDDSWVN